MAAVMFLRKAMRYYRLWIYTCNAVLLVSVLVFLGVAAGVVSHPYFSLVPAPPAYHPTLLYGYVALLLQAGILQALGCMGALRLSQKLLNIYWLLLLFLLLGDVVVGLVWLYRFSHLKDGLRPYARATLHNHYGRDPDITRAWDTLQSTSHCCGVVTPRDYNTTWWDIGGQNYRSSNTLTLPSSCCTSATEDDNYNEGRRSSSFSISSSPDTRRMTSYQADQQARHVPNYPPDDGGGGGGGNGKASNSSSASNTRYHSSSGGTRGRHERNITCSGGSKSFRSPPRTNYYEQGCHTYLEKWLLNSTETLMILGFCVIAFIKLCFVGILRFEIQEMIQKIKVLQGETPVTPNPELAAALGLVSPDKAAECGLLSSGGDGEGGTGGGGDDGGGGGDSRDQDSPAATPLTQPRLNHLSGHTDGAESDTNSHCALITDTPIRRPQPDKRKPNGNNNDVTELRELRHIRQTQI